MDQTSSSNQGSPFLTSTRPNNGSQPNSMAFGGPSNRGSPSAPLPPALHHGGFSAFGVPGQPPAKSSPSQQNPQQQQQFQQQAQAQAQQQRQQGQPNTVGPAAWAYANAQLNSYAAAQRQRQPTGGEQSSNSSNNTNSNAAAAYYAPSPSSQQHSNTSSVSSPIISGIGSGGGGASAFASTQLSQLPPGMADLGALNLHSAASSQPVSAASSPGWQHRRLPSAGAGTVHHTVGGGSGSTNYEHTAPSHNPRVAASSVTGKRLNWGEMICATIAHSEHGRLVIQDLFEQMCARFPEVQEWAFGKDWEVSLGTTTTKGQTRRRYTTPGADRREVAHLRTLTNILGSPSNLSFVQARVKNRIKSTLSIKGHLFVKVPRPSSAAGKGSWWTLSQEAQDAYHEGRLGPLLKLSGTMPAGGTSSAGHSRGGSVSESLTMTSTDSRYDSPGPSTGGSAAGTGPTSGVATPLKQHSMPHPLAQHVEAASASPNPTPNPTMASGEHSQQAQQAHQLAQLQAQLLRQQQAQREVLPGSYDPNAPPSGAAYFPHHQFYNFEGLGGNGSSGSSGAMLMGGQGQGGGSGANGGGNGDDSLFSSSMQSIYGTSFGNHMNPGGMAMPPGRFGGNQSMIDMDKMGTSYGDTPMMPASFESGSFGATMRALGGMPPWKGAGMDYRTTPGQPGEGSANGSGMGESNPSGTSASDSIDSASGSSNSGPSGNAPSTGASSWGVGGGSWGIGATQSIPHLGGPQSMPFPAAAGSQGAVGRDMPASSARGTSMNASGGSSNRPDSSDGTTIGNPFDFSSSASSSHGSSAVNGPPGPGGMYPYSFSGLGDDANGGKGAAVPPNFYGNGVGGGGFFQGGGGAGPHHHHHHHHHAGGNNPFGMSIPGGYAMPSAVPINSPFHPNFTQSRLSYLNTNAGGVNNGGGQTAGGAGAGAMDMVASGSGHGAAGGTDGSASASNTVPPSPADSTSAFFAFTPAAGPVDAPGSSPSRPASGGEGGPAGEGGASAPSLLSTSSGATGMGEEGSALGPLVGKRKVSSAARNLPNKFGGSGGGGGGAAAPPPGAAGAGAASASASNNTSTDTGAIAREGSAADKGKGGLGELQKVEEGFALPPPATQH
ncbi:hypothetical protein BCV69DRAFT_189679 [Microstroma glucosiphilum]|uniref:Fork-head domain-containing protein n=1 Tax=Pseudomicrostroma glucosiphilum TaxID=1684307 RepID=A0A316U8J9_9BASI|nr:hypothetical protein BCV69DRAFT_189679 [Pseudomicrostroma glucosiphilum]PWN21184.1 hypothetical protein BCV69DRAFT_189679 [Pseudomicrostroma glucosiphilum]